jgi:HEPN domain-containing protein
VNRSDFQNLAALRLAEAECLLEAGHYCGAYYVAGYVIECALKACIARQIVAEEYPPTANLKESHFTHDLRRLLKTAGLEQELGRQSQQLRDNWKLAVEGTSGRGWDESRRYETTIMEQEARAMIEAIVDENDGVLIWLKNHW